MSFQLSTDRIIISDTDGHIVFDTNEKLFNGTNFVSGSIERPSRQATWRHDPGETGVAHDVNINTDVTLASIHASANAVVGSFKVSASDGKGVHGLGWFAATGTYVHYWSGQAIQGESPGDHHYSRNRAAYSFFASGGNLRLNERVTLGADHITNADTSITLSAITFEFKLYCGTFT